MDVSYLLATTLKIKVAKWGTPKKYLKKYLDRQARLCERLAPKDLLGQGQAPLDLLTLSHLQNLKDTYIG